MLNKSSIQKMSYDRINDILYIDFENARSNSYADDGPFGIEIMRDMDTDEVTGLMVYYPRKLMMDRQQKLTDLGYSIQLQSCIQ